MHKLTVYYPSQLPFYLVCWVAKQRVQQELISTKIPLVATLKYAYLFSCTHTIFLFVALTCYNFASCVLYFYCSFNLGVFINEYVGAEAYKPVWMGAKVASKCSRL